ncbi:lysoplasmalogenase-like protein TMEM86A [Centruroides sculpturatus]|uniref:lysoplasmalogenase-like protein TMEM86A n=1 Tax=Centruroides sculpturatus TaxID=218467 RepID=UPI000C6D061E|nr:lysoplasmalogenase-like protein TMEM86A [Centruroides sculpturatus]
MAILEPKLKSVGPKLVPFFKTVAVYFVLAIPGDNPSWFACLIKCLPVGWLCIFVILHGMSLDEKHTYSRRILTGLIFSCFGDLLLIWPCYFIWGMLSFAIAHVLYILAFGMSPLNPIAGLVCISLGTTATYIMYPGMSGLYSVLVPVYIYLLMLMVWRAVARVQLFEDLWTWTKLCSCGGGILFALSDSLIGITMFYTPVPHAGTVIMVAYYAGQLGIALSAVDSSEMAAVSLAHENTNSTGCHSARDETSFGRISSKRKIHSISPLSRDHHDKMKRN